MTHPYASRSYARALAPNGPVFQATSIDALLWIKPIPNSTYRDASGVYPFAADLRPTAKADLIQELRAHSLVALTFVTDPLATDLGWTSDLDLSRAYKTHHVIDRSLAPVRFSKHHRREVRRALRHCEVRRIELQDYLVEWREIYETLRRRHTLGATHSFPPGYFEALAKDPAFPVFAAFAGDRMVSCHIWARHDSVAYSHLAASTEEGYQLGASYAVYDHAIQAFGNCEMINLGGVPDSGNAGGLDFFKRGFANDIRVNRICGVIADREAYKALCREFVPGAPGDDYFPAYRSDAAAVSAANGNADDRSDAN